MANKAYKFRIYPTKEQEDFLVKTFGCVRFVYNKMLAERKETYEKLKDNMTLLKKQKIPTPAKYKKEFEWLKEVDSLALANAQLNLQTAFSNFFSGKTKYPKFKNRKSRQSYTTNMVNGNIKILDAHIKLPKLTPLRMKQHREIPSHHVIKSCTISRSSTGKYHISILTEYEHKPKKKEIKQVVGLDFAMDGLFVESEEGKKANYPQFYRRAEEKLAKEQRILSKKTKGSSRWEKQRIRVAKLHEKVANQRRDFLHKQSWRLANQYDCVVIEDLNMKEMSQALRFGKSVADNGWGMFSTFLEYKLKDQGKRFLKIDKWFPSSKMCSDCGNVKAALSLSERTYSCECGFVSDRDWNAAINIKNEGKLIIGLS
ncbi:RNA-guided endonuclease TnpB family protein [Sporosarcina thermotolerans]|uniref:RNA-guided endonuclease TnpB family protein n=2 Tax=Sporosarcina thermotolerans TaxID=633404 RepID=UPI0024BBFD65|nr:RNA-guided endonuclease TnpB family protein [Sporosarcina thermotolerans]WHT49547.1 RNA-guided endonuclease TnpB family protein [Sporosarcina thermotolerans]